MMAKLDFVLRMEAKLNNTDITDDINKIQKAEFEDEKNAFTAWRDSTKAKLGGTVIGIDIYLLPSSGSPRTSSIIWLPYSRRHYKCGCVSLLCMYN